MIFGTEIPQGKWCIAKLSEITDVNPRLDKSAISDDLEVSFVPMPAVEAESGIINVSSTRKFSEVKKGYTPFREGDVLFAKITPCMENGKMSVVPEVRNGIGFGSTEFHVLRSPQGVDAKYVYYYVSSKPFRHVAEHNMTGAVGQRRVPTAYLSDCDIPLPPSNEQHRIVAKIEELFSELDKGIENLKAAREQLKVYRQALLIHAFEGKLTAQWRKQNRDQLETAAALRARIQTVREQRYQQQLQQWQTTGGSKPKAPKAMLPLTTEELAELPELPEGWAWVKLGDLTWSVKDGPHFSPKYVEQGIPFISGGNVRPDGVNFENAKFISQELHEELCKRCKPEVGDVLYTKGGTTGIARVNTYDLDFNVWVHVAVLKLTSAVKPFYLQHALNSSFCYSQSQKYTHGVGNQDLGLTRMVNIVLAICSIEEQEEVIKVIDDKISVIDKLELTITTSLQQAEAMRQSILKRAFSGQLVPQDPHDEPASVLLARIRTEREQAVKPKQRRKGV
ncbi:MAG: restriction endonuclease subunit S [Gallionella sp.]|nr:restriction endonuclease subunit S [Gallionella sp.]MDD4945885.1 restriction endonuclease subunit S [Gallionella sp.]MDD5612640.1 restriction endonuclease subunit S [Gallionella sp.]